MTGRRLPALAAALALVAGAAGCACACRRDPPPPADPVAKIAFDLARPGPDGLEGPPDGRRSLAYEFCIPAREERAREVLRADPTLRVERSAPGRAGCGAGLWLCLGDTGGPGWRDRLLAVARLPFVGAIRETHFE